MKGFTLFELLIVIVLMAIAFVLVPPLFSGAVKNAELRSSVREIAAALKIARTRAVTRQHETTLTLDVAGKRYRVSSSQRAKQLPRHLHFKLDTARSEQTSSKTGSIRFFPDGSATGGRITITGGDRSYRVDVDWLTGRIAVR